MVRFTYQNERSLNPNTNTNIHRFVEWQLMQMTLSQQINIFVHNNCIDSPFTIDHRATLCNITPTVVCTWLFIIIFPRKKNEQNIRNKIHFHFKNIFIEMGCSNSTSNNQHKTQYSKFEKRTRKKWNTWSSHHRGQIQCHLWWPITSVYWQVIRNVLNFAKIIHIQHLTYNNKKEEWSIKKPTKTNVEKLLFETWCSEQWTISTCLKS